MREQVQGNMAPLLNFLKLKLKIQERRKTNYHLDIYFRELRIYDRKIQSFQLMKSRRKDQ